MAEIPTLAIAQHAIGLPKSAAFRHKFIRRGGVKFEKVEVAGDDAPRVDRVGQLRCLRAIKVAGDASFGTVAINRQQCGTNFKTAK